MRAWEALVVGGSDPCGSGGLLGEQPDFWVWGCSPCVALLFSQCPLPLTWWPPGLSISWEEAWLVSLTMVCVPLGLVRP